MSRQENKKSTGAALFLTFFKIGAFSFGGGSAMIPLIQEEVVHKKRWAKDGEILDIVALAESTPGPIAVNTATFIGRKVGGFRGAFLATLGVILPSFLIIYLLSFVLRQFRDLRAVNYAFIGLRAGVLALVARALFTMYRQSPKGVFAYLLMGAAFVSVAFFNLNVLVVILLCAGAGLAGLFLGNGGPGAGHKASGPGGRDRGVKASSDGEEDRK